MSWLDLRERPVDWVELMRGFMRSYMWANLSLYNYTQRTDSYLKFFFFSFTSSRPDTGTQSRCFHCDEPLGNKPLPLPWEHDKWAWRVSAVPGVLVPGSDPWDKHAVRCNQMISLVKIPQEALNKSGPVFALCLTIFAVFGYSFFMTLGCRVQAKAIAWPQTHTA